MFGSEATREGKGQEGRLSDMGSKRHRQRGNAGACIANKEEAKRLKNGPLRGRSWVKKRLWQTRVTDPESAKYDEKNGSTFVEVLEFV